MKSHFFTSVGLLVVVTATLAVQQRLDAVRHELSRFNHATRLQTTAAAAAAAAAGSYRNFRPASGRGIYSASSSSSSGSIEPGLLPYPAYRMGRPARFAPQLKVVRLAVLAPSDPEHQFSLLKILPAITLAARTIERSSSNSSGPLSGWRIQIVDRDSKCSSIYGPLEAIDLYNSKAIGPRLFCFDAFCKM